jgi:hypothetical protein
MTIRIEKLLGRRLQSELKGRRDFVTLSDVLRQTEKGTLVSLDFSSVETATASWWTAAVLPLYRMSAHDQMDLYFLIANGLEADWLDDLRLVGQFNNQSFLVTGKKPESASVIGSLDESLLRTLQLVQQMKIATGAKLSQQCPEEEIGPTAWNNRLRDLYEQRLLRRLRRGREQLYSPVLEVIYFNGRKLPARAS